MLVGERSRIEEEEGEGEGEGSIRTLLWMFILKIILKE